MRFLLIFIYLFLEVFITFEMIDFLGVLGFVLEIIFSAILGLFILINYRFFLGDALVRLREREISYEAFVGSNIFRILGATLLILPGGLTDILGILMQFSALGFLAVKPFMKKSAPNSEPTSNKPQNSEIIDVEVIEK